MSISVTSSVLSSLNSIPSCQHPLLGIPGWMYKGHLWLPVPKIELSYATAKPVPPPFCPVSCQLTVSPFSMSSLTPPTVSNTKTVNKFCHLPFELYAGFDHFCYSPGSSHHPPLPKLLPLPPTTPSMLGPPLVLLPHLLPLSPLFICSSPSSPAIPWMPPGPLCLCFPLCYWATWPSSHL